MRMADGWREGYLAALVGLIENWCSQDKVEGFGEAVRVAKGVLEVSE